MDEVYDLLEPRKKERQKLNVFHNKGEARQNLCPKCSMISTS